MSALYLELECYAGSTIRDAAKEAINLSESIGIPIYFDFNNVKCACYPDGSDVETLVENYHTELCSGQDHKFANSR